MTVSTKMDKEFAIANVFTEICIISKYISETHEEIAIFFYQPKFTILKSINLIGK